MNTTSNDTNMTTTPNIISDARALELRKLHKRFATWLGGRSSYLTSSVPEELREWNNDAMAQLNRYDFVTKKPVTWFAYHNDDARLGTPIVGWTSDDVIGTVTRAGHVFRSNMGDKRRHVRVMGINGVEYAGVATMSAGNYVRLKAVKARVS